MFTISHVIHHFENLTKMRRAVEIDLRDRVTIDLNDPIKTITFRVKDVTIDCEATRCTMRDWGYLGSETEHWDRFVRIVVLEDRTDRLDSLQVFIFVGVEIMQGRWIGGVTI